MSVLKYYQDFAIVRGGSGATGPQLSSLLYGSFSSCLQFCTTLMTFGLRFNNTNSSAAWAICSTRENANAESFTRSTSNGNTDYGNVRYAFNSYWNQVIPDKIADCLGRISNYCDRILNYYCLEL